MHTCEAFPVLLYNVTPVYQRVIMCDLSISHRQVNDVLPRVTRWGIAKRKKLLALDWTDLKRACAPHKITHGRCFNDAKRGCENALTIEKRVIIGNIYCCTERVVYVICLVPVIGSVNVSFVDFHWIYLRFRDIVLIKKQTPDRPKKWR